MPESQPPLEPVDASIVEPDVTAEIVPDPGPPPTAPAPDFDERGVPSLDHVRSKIEGRYATAIGAAELAEATPEGRTVQEQEAERAEKAKAKLEEIRKSMG